MNLPSSIEVVKALRTRAPRNRLPQLPIEQALPYAIAYLREEITGFELLALIGGKHAAHNNTAWHWASSTIAKAFKLGLVHQ